MFFSDIILLVLWPFIKKEIVKNISKRKMKYLEPMSKKKYKINRLSHVKACDYLAQLL